MISRPARPLALLLAGGLLGCASFEDLPERIDDAGVFAPLRTTAGSSPLVELGQSLFFEPELSGNRNIACSTCHLPELHGVDHLPLSQGEGGAGLGPAREGGALLARNTPAPFNLSFASALFWDGRVELLADGSIAAPVALPEGIETPLEAQAILPLLEPDELRGHPGENELADMPASDPSAIWDAIAARLRALPGYRAPFEAAFPETPFEEITIAHVARAIAAFEMHLWELTDTPFDRYLGTSVSRGDLTALSGASLRGADLFFGDAGCARCHRGPLLSDGEYHNIGVPQLGPGTDPATGLDEGRFDVSGDPRDRFAFRTPPLRNVALTAPYMHDGAYASLEDAIVHHLDPEAALRTYGGDSHDAPEVIDAILETLDPETAPSRALSGGEVADLVAFLEALTSETELSLPERPAVPSELPSGLPIDATP